MLIYNVINWTLSKASKAALYYGVRNEWNLSQGKAKYVMEISYDVTVTLI